MKIAVYSGEIPSTTFIERLINGLSDRKDVKLYLFGRFKTKVPIYKKTVTAVGYRNTIGQAVSGLKYRLLFLTKPGLWKEFKMAWSPGHLSIKQRIKLWGKILPVIYAELDIFHIQWAKNLKDWIFLEKMGVRVICSFRGTHINSSPLANTSLVAMYRELFPKCSGFYGVSQAIVKEAGLYADVGRKSKVVYSGLDLDNFRFSEKTRSTTPLKIISVGRPHWKKGYHYALETCRLLVKYGFEFSYTIVGGKTEELQYLIADRGLKSYIHFQDRLSLEEVKMAIKEHDVLLLPSVEEGIANVVLESMALGTPVISTDCGGMTEVVEEGISGFIVPTRNTIEMAKRIQYLAGLGEKELSTICKNARFRIETYHQQSHMIDGAVELYKSVLLR